MVESGYTTQRYPSAMWYKVEACEIVKRGLELESGLLSSRTLWAPVAERQ
jgi:hypothetical protein